MANIFDLGIELTMAINIGNAWVKPSKSDGTTCNGWSDATASHYGSVAYFATSNGSYYETTEYCINAKPVLCIKR